jgi:hypothetical protein
VKGIITCAILALSLIGFVFYRSMSACGCGREMLPPTIMALPH